MRDVESNLHLPILGDRFFDRYTDEALGLCSQNLFQSYGFGKDPQETPPPPPTIPTIETAFTGHAHAGIIEPMQNPWEQPFEIKLPEWLKYTDAHPTSPLMAGVASNDRVQTKQYTQGSDLAEMGRFTGFANWVAAILQEAPKQPYTSPLPKVTGDVRAGMLDTFDERIRHHKF